MTFPREKECSGALDSGLRIPRTVGRASGVCGAIGVQSVPYFTFHRDGHVVERMAGCGRLDTHRACTHVRCVRLPWSSMPLCMCDFVAHVLLAHGGAAHIKYTLYIYIYIYIYDNCPATHRAVAGAVGTPSRRPPSGTRRAHRGAGGSRVDGP